jgi:hypothetical protein
LPVNKQPRTKGMHGRHGQKVQGQGEGRAQLSEPTKATLSKADQGRFAQAGQAKHAPVAATVTM